MKQRGGFWGLTRLGFSDGIRSKLFTLIDNGTTEKFQEALYTAIDKYRNIDDITNKDGVHLLTYACTKGRKDIVEVLKDYDPNFSIVDFKEKVTGFTQGEFPSFTFVRGRGSPLLEAISSGKPDLVKYLLTLKVEMFVRHFISPLDVDYSSDWYKRIALKKGGPLELAITLNPTVFDDLLNYYTERKTTGSFPEDEYNKLLSECIPAACYRYSPELLEKLFQAGAKLQKRAETVCDLPDSSVAEMFMNHPNITLDIKKKLLQTLITYGLDVNFVSNAKKSLLQTTFDESGVNTVMAEFLIDNGARKEGLGTNADEKLREANLLQYYIDTQLLLQAKTRAAVRNVVPPAQGGGKRTRRGRARGRKTRRRKSRA